MGRSADVVKTSSAFKLLLLCFFLLVNILGSVVHHNICLVRRTKKNANSLNGFHFFSLALKVLKFDMTLACISNGCIP